MYYVTGNIYYGCGNGGKYASGVSAPSDHSGFDGCFINGNGVM